MSRASYRVVMSRIVAGRKRRGIVVSNAQEEAKKVAQRMIEETRVKSI